MTSPKGTYLITFIFIVIISHLLCLHYCVIIFNMEKLIKLFSWGLMYIHLSHIDLR
jgi:hypothetical protein